MEPKDQKVSPRLLLLKSLKTMDVASESSGNDLDRDFQNAKAFMLKTSLHSNLNV